MIGKVDTVISKHLTVKISEEGEIEILIGGEPWHQCNYTLLEKSINLKEITALPSKNVDELIEKMDHSLEKKKGLVPSNTKLWAYASSLKAFAENGYNTNLLPANFGIPLLKKLTQVGDMKAKEVFSKEILKKFLSNTLNVVIFLLKENYHQYLEGDQIQQLVNNEEFLNMLLLILQSNDKEIRCRVSELLKYNNPSFILSKFNNFIKFLDVNDICEIISSLYLVFDEKEITKILRENIEGIKEMLIKDFIERIKIKLDFLDRDYLRTVKDYNRKIEVLHKNYIKKIKYAKIIHNLEEFQGDIIE